MAQDKPIVIKRPKKVIHDDHGGAWKIAYADFVTAMMAFFLMMWLVSVTPEETRKGLSEYFSSPRGFLNKIGSGIDGGTDPLDKDETLNKKKEEEAMTEEGKKLMTVMNNIERVIKDDQTLKDFADNIEMQLTDEGLKIDIMDSINRTVFRQGDSVLQPYMSRLIIRVIEVVSQVPNYISIEGHSAVFERNMIKAEDKWYLSTNRANVIRKFIETNGLSERAVRVTGKADLEPYDARDRNNPRNVRASITLLNSQSISNFQRSMPDTSLGNRK